MLLIVEARGEICGHVCTHKQASPCALMHSPDTWNARTYLCNGLN
jgi:hypothetical protein